MAFYLKGVKLAHKKNTSNFSPINFSNPKKVTIPTSMHIGSPAIPVVKKGDHVDIGTLIAEPGERLSSPVYASISGTVTEILDFLLSNGSTCPAITIESDDTFSTDSNIAPPTITSRDELVEALKISGIVGLGGAGFPTYAKFQTNKPIKYLLINGAECEPYITSDTVTMLNRSNDILFAIEELIKYFDIENVIIGIENNKPKAIETLKKITAENEKISVKVLPSYYPQGAEKVLIYHLTGISIPLGKLPIDFGCVVINSTTTAEIGNYIKTGHPLTHRTVTVDGGAVKEPKNVTVPIGASFEDLFEFAGGFKDEPKKVIYGGPMMGITVPDLSAPILKNTNAVLAFSEKEIASNKTTACIRCGRCINFCPFGINPPAILKALKNNDIEGLEKFGANLCMECGCCSYVCPAKIPNVHNNRIAKTVLRNNQAKEKK